MLSQHVCRRGGAQCGNQRECVVMTGADWGFGKRWCFFLLICSAPLCSELLSSAADNRRELLNAAFVCQEFSQRCCLE